MTRVEQRLSDLLHSATPEPPVDVPFERVAGQVRRRRRLAATGTALGMAVVLAASAGIGVNLSRYDEAAQQAAGPQQKTITVPGVDRDEAARIVEACSRPQPPEEGDERYKRLSSAPRQLYNVLDGPGGPYALIYSRSAYSVCTRVTADRWVGPLHRLDTGEWLPGDLDVDSRGGTSGSPSGSRVYTMVAAGRVSDRVASVRIDGPDGARTTVKPLNGTFLAVIHIESASDEALAFPGPRPTFTAYGADGQVLAERVREPSEGCYTTPDGKYLGTGDKRPPGNGPCKPATRWNP